MDYDDMKYPYGDDDIPEIDLPQEEENFDVIPVQVRLRRTYCEARAMLCMTTTFACRGEMGRAASSPMRPVFRS